MRILHQSKSGKWEQIDSEPYTNESELQDLLADDVSVLPFDDIGYDEPFITIGKEVGLHGNSLDLLAISPRGHIAVIETKLSSNPEIRREVVGQVLSYAASLWQKTYDDLEYYFTKLLHNRKIQFVGNLYEYVQHKCPDITIDQTEFIQNVQKRLQVGSFSLLIVVDALGDSNKELVDIANYLNDRTGQEIDFYVVEVERIADHAGSYLLPRLANPPHKNISSNATTIGGKQDQYDRKPITQQELLSRLTLQEQKIAEYLIKQANLDNRIGISWRKTGFSLWTMIPRKITDGIFTYESGYSYLFFQASEKSGSMYKALGFWYPEASYQSLPKLQTIVSKYRTAYTQSTAYNAEKKEILIDKLSKADAEKLVKEMLATAQKLAIEDTENKYINDYR